MAQDFEYSGFGISATFSADPSLKLFITECTLPGFDLGDPIDITSNETVGAMEQAPADLGTPSEFTITARENLADRAKFMSILGQHQTITFQFKKTKNRDTAMQLAFADAWLSNYESSSHVIGESPTVTLTCNIGGGTHSGDASTFHPEGTLSPLS